MIDAETRKYSKIALSLTAAGLAWALFCWGYFWFQMQKIEARHGASVLDFFEIPEFRHSLSQRWFALAPEFLFNTTGSGLWWTLAGVAIVIGFWVATPKLDTAPPWTWASVVTLPFFLGASRIPSGIVDVARRMSEVGLGDPGLFGVGVAEVSAAAWLGVLVGADLLIVFAVWRRIRHSAKTEG